MPHKIYCLSGLGIDERAFANLYIPGYELVFIPWIEPLKNESLPSYAQRMFESVQIEDDYLLLGVSFGGMIAQEFEKIKKPRKLFLISSMSDAKSLPWYLRILVKLNLHQLIPSKSLTQPNFFAYRLFGLKTSSQKKALKEFLQHTTASYLKWAIGAIFSWKNNSTTSGIIIHGSNDHLLKCPAKVDLNIENGGHFIVLINGMAISKFIERCLGG